METGEFLRDVWEGKCGFEGGKLRTFQGGTLDQNQQEKVEVWGNRFIINRASQGSLEVGRTNGVQRGMNPG